MASSCLTCHCSGSGVYQFWLLHSGERRELVWEFQPSLQSPHSYLKTLKTVSPCSLGPISSKIVGFSPLCPESLVSSETTWNSIWPFSFLLGQNKIQNKIMRACIHFQAAAMGTWFFWCGLHGAWQEMIPWPFECRYTSKWDQFSEIIPCSLLQGLVSHEIPSCPHLPLPPLTWCSPEPRKSSDAHIARQRQTCYPLHSGTWRVRTNPGKAKTGFRNMIVGLMGFSCSHFQKAWHRIPGTIFTTSKIGGSQWVFVPR